MSFPYLPFYVADYHSKTHYLTLAEHGAYLKLLLLCWETPGCTIPNEREWIQRRLSCSDEEYETIVQTIISEYFKPKRDRLQNCRLTAEYETIKNKFEKRSLAGQKGGRPRKSLKNNKPDKSNALSKQKQNGLYPEPEPEPEPYSKKEAPLSPMDLDQALSLYNEMAARSKLPVAQKMNSARSSKMRARLKDAGGLQGWVVALDEVENSTFLTGCNPRGWKADLDFMLQESSFTKIMEGSYRRTKPKDDRTQELANWVKQGEIDEQTRTHSNADRRISETGRR